MEEVVKNKTILAIETSCDETAMAVVAFDGDKFQILAEKVSSQVKIHAEFGGVVPTLAKREHLINLPLVWEDIKAQLCHTGAIATVSRDSTDPVVSLRDDNVSIIDEIHVTVGPGLEPALWTGIGFANELAKELNRPLYGANHLEGHIYSNWLKAPVDLPALVLIISGGHTILLLIEKIGEYKILGETLDDAVGEAYDKVAKMLKLPYPGGPEVEKLAGLGDAKKVILPRPMLHSQDYNFSLSGLKTAVLYYLRDNPEVTKEDLCAGFQAAVVEVLLKKCGKAITEFGPASLLVCGGVAANEAIKKALSGLALKNDIIFHAPELKYNTDNAVMIALAGFLGKKYPNDKAVGGLNLLS